MNLIVTVTDDKDNIYSCLWDANINRLQSIKQTLEDYNMSLEIDCNKITSIEIDYI